MSEIPHPDEVPEQAEAEEETPVAEDGAGDPNDRVDGRQPVADWDGAPPVGQESEPPEPEPELEDTITFKRSHFYAALIPLAFILGLSVGFIFWGRQGAAAVASAASAPVNDGQGASEAAASGAGQPAAQGADGESIPRFDIPLDDDPQLGPSDAPITIVEFSDYECPYCRRFHEETFFQLLEAYEGQIRFVYRDFPLASIHGNAIAAAEAANCAREQEAFWEYHDLLFKLEQGLGQQAYMSYAQELGLDAERFEECLESRRYQEEVENDYNFAARLGVRSTPTFFINGLPLVGAQPFEVFQQVIDQELAGEIP